MTRGEKLIKRLLDRPKDFTGDELRTLLAGLEFEETDTGKTGGSMRKFVNPESVVISLHKPHPNNTLKRYPIDQIIEILEREGLI